MKILYVTTVGGTMVFFKKFIEELLQEGHIVEIATHESDTSKVRDCYRDWGCVVHQISTSRSPFNKGNFVAIKQIKKLVEENKYDIVHCHTPIAAMCTRLACRKVRKQGTKVFYTAHGFHFFKGAPLKNWLLYYTVEKICAHYTDLLITINKEDYALAQKKLKAKRIEYVPGVGIDLEKFAKCEVNFEEKRKELEIPNDAILLLSVGELNQNKNHETVIRAVADLDVYYIIAGKGGLQEHLQGVINELGLNDRVKLIGFRRDVPQLCKIADIFAFPSHREGLSVSVMEAMASELPVVCSQIRGNTDLIDENGGAYFNSKSVMECKDAIKKVIASSIDEIGKHNANRIKEFEVSRVNSIMRNLYEKGE